MQDEIRSWLRESAQVKEVMAQKLSGQIEAFASILIKCFKNGNKLLVCGNGGSAADAQHFVAEFIVRYKKERPGLPAIALTTNPSVVTAHVNDYNFATLFERQIESLGKPGDVLVGISTSGNSENVIRAIKKAKEMGLMTVSLLGRDGGKMKGLCDLDIIVPSNDTPRIQEAHICIIHIVCELTENRLYAGV